MKKFLSVVLVLLIVIGIAGAQETRKSLSGGTARTAALGGGPTNPYIQDYSDIFINPAYAVMYKDLLYSDVGYAFAAYQAAGQYVGWTLGLGDLALGISIGKREGPMFAENAYGAGTFGPSDYMIASVNGYSAGFLGVNTAEPRVPLQIYGAFKLGPMTVGGALYRSSWSRTDDATASVGNMQKAEYSNGQTGVKGGLLLELSQYFTVDASLLFRLNGSTVNFTDANAGANPSAGKYDVTGSELGVSGRAFMKFSDRLTVIPQVRFSTFGYKPEVTLTTTVAPPAPVNTTPNDYGRTEFEVGVGVNSKFDGGWVVAGISMQSIKLTNDVTTQPGGAGTPLVTTKNTNSWLDLPKVNFGAEFQLLSWLSGRFGYFKRLSNNTVTTEPPSPATKTEQSISGEPGYAPSLGFTATQQQLALGLSLSIDRISLDGYVGERFLAAMPTIISGNIQDMFGVLSMSVKF